ncbi:glucosylceramidase isoform X2 [Orussus abietinus]|uniref:glucosylceramidase isoform X2 n=1 Tax=Orussus abietinus TaxID=222816 RepID=UPI00062668B9|nr:glucosylceramidase isoform X2 [Orussus abietinus]
MYRRVLAFAFVAGVCHSCIPRDFGSGSVVCVCNSTHCDFTPKLNTPNEGTFLHYVSSKAGQRLSPSDGTFSNETIEGASLIVNKNKKYQTMHGFGGAFTDSAGINIKGLRPAAQEFLLQSYFGKNGSEYNLGRTPIGGTDFSLRPYELDDHENDYELKYFSLTQEDYIYKIPLMQRALEINPELKFLAAAWSAPPWMKVDNRYVGYGHLQQKYYQTYANYLIKFLDAYKSHGLKMWTISTGNEPNDAILEIKSFNSMGWTFEELSQWVANNLGPTLKASQHNETIIIGLDDQRCFVPWYISKIFENEKVRSYVSGIGLHWYTDEYFPPILLDWTHDQFPDKFLITTESCVVPFLDYNKVVLGSWERAEYYILYMIQNINHWVSGWVDWNLALNMEGGPNWAKNAADAAIIVNAEKDEFYKQPIFYAIAHFSKFIPRGSTRVDITNHNDIKAMAFTTPENETVTIVYNTLSTPQNVSINDSERGNINLMLPPYSIHTVVYK